MATIHFGGKVSRNEKRAVKFTIDTATLGSATVSSSTGTCGPSKNPTQNPAITTSTSTTSPSTMLTILPAEWPKTSNTAYVGTEITMSDGRILTSKVEYEIIW